MTYYTSSKYYGRTRTHDSIVPCALRALGTKTLEQDSSSCTTLEVTLEVLLERRVVEEGGEGRGS